MDFLRRLAPPRTGDMTRAVAAMPARFAAQGPMRAAAVEGPAVPHDGGEPVAMPAAGLAGRSVAQPVAVPQAASPRVVERPESAVPPTARSHTRTSSAPEVPPMRAMPAPQAERRSALATPASFDGRLELPMREATRVEHHELRVATRDIPQPRTASIHAAPRFVPAAPIKPLSETTLAARALPSAAQRPIIHVTIDRIDVRAPAAAQRPNSAAKPRTAATSTTLSDYLRARGPSRNGGAS